MEKNWGGAKEKVRSLLLHGKRGFDRNPSGSDLKIKQGSLAGQGVPPYSLKIVIIGFMFLKPG